MNKQELQPVFDHFENNKDVEGDIAMFGVSKYDTAIVVPWAKQHGKKVYMFDSFEGLPEPDDDDIEPEFYDGMNPKYKPGFKLVYHKGEQTNPLEGIQSVLGGYDNYETIKGFYEDSIPKQEEKEKHYKLKFCTVLIDVDYTSSLNICLDYVWERLQPKGMLCTHEVMQKNIVRTFNERGILLKGQDKPEDVPFNVNCAGYTIKE